MRNRKCTKPKRLLSFFLAVLVAVSILPMSWLQASAATEKHPDAVTITVTDGNGKALADAVVNYTIESQTDVENPISGIVMTDEDGCAEVLSGDDYKENDLELTAQVSKEHYESNDTAIVSLPITSADQNFEVSLRCMLIEDVTVTGVTEAYADGKKFPAATVEGIVTDGEHPDKVTYELYTYGKDETTGKDEWVSAGQTSELPQISEVGNYKLAVSVDRGEQYEIYRTEVDSEITLGKITDYTITPLNETYTGAKEGQELPKYDAVTVTGGRKTDNVTYKLGTGEKTETIPQIQYAGTYSVTVRVERENYEPFEQTYTAVLKSKANEYKGTYDGKYHRLIESVEGTDPNNKDVVVEYSVSEKKEESSWSREVPKGVNAGSYPVYIRIDRDNDGKFEETIDAIATIDPVSIELKNISDEIPESVTYEEARNRTYDYSVKAFGVDDQEFDSSVVKITYSIESAEKEDSSEESGDTEGTETGNASTDMKEIATIDEGGQLQVQEAGGGHAHLLEVARENVNVDILSLGFETNISVLDRMIYLLFQSQKILAENKILHIDTFDSSIIMQTEEVIKMKMMLKNVLKEEAFEQTRKHVLGVINQWLEMDPMRFNMLAVELKIENVQIIDFLNIISTVEYDEFVTNVIKMRPTVSEAQIIMRR